MSEVTRAQIEDFLGGRRVAVIGVSRNKMAYSRRLWGELRKHGYEALAVNPKVAQLEGGVCYPNIKEITPSPERAVIVLPAEKTEQAVRDCADAKVKDIWLHQAPGSKADAGALRVAQEQGLNLITGWCLFMFLPRSAVIHQCHGGLLKLLRAYPK